MYFVGILTTITLFWFVKLFVAWVVYTIAMWFNAPDWVVIAVVAIAASETKVEFII